jgi:hypothetical protein
MDDVDPLLIVPDLRDEAVFVASNIEDSTFSNRIGMGEIEPRINQIRPCGVFGDPIPIFERLFGIGMDFPKLARAFRLMILIEILPQINIASNLRYGFQKNGPLCADRLLCFGSDRLGIAQGSEGD